MPFRFITLLALLCLTPLLPAQTEEPPARYQIYGGYSYLSNAINGVPGARHSINGWDASVGFPAWHHLRFVIDVTGYSATNDGATQHPYFIMGGGQYNWRLGRRETIYGKALFGDAGINRFWGPNAMPGRDRFLRALHGWRPRYPAHAPPGLPRGRRLSVFLLQADQQPDRDLALLLSRIAHKLRPGFQWFSGSSSRGLAYAVV